MNQLVLDIDLDRFVDPVVRGGVRNVRPDSRDHVPWPSRCIHHFLETNHSHPTGIG